MAKYAERQYVGVVNQLVHELRERTPRSKCEAIISMCVPAVDWRRAAKELAVFDLLERNNNFYRWAVDFKTEVTYDVSYGNLRVHLFPFRQN